MTFAIKGDDFLAIINEESILIYEVRLIYVGNRFAVKYGMGCYPDLLPLFKAMQKYQGTPILASLRAGHNKATDSLALCPVYGVKLHLDMGSSCVTSCSR